MGSPAAGFECGLNGVCSGVGEMGEKCPILALGLLLGLQLGVTFFKNRGYTFGVLEGGDRGDGTCRFEGVEGGKLPICDIGFCVQIM